MRKIISVLLALTLCMTMPVLAETASLTLEPLLETLRPGKAITVCFDAPAAGSADIQVLDEQEKVVSVAALGYAASAGYNELLWNGTYESVPAPAGNYTLTVRLNGETASTPIAIGEVSPYLAYIVAQSTAVTPAQPLTVSYYASVDGMLTWGAWVDGVWQQIGSQLVQAGENTLTWDGMVNNGPLNDGEYSFTLMLTDVTAFDSNEEHVTVTLSGFMDAVTAEPAAVEAAANVPEEVHAEPAADVPSEEDAPSADTTADVPADVPVTDTSADAADDMTADIAADADGVEAFADDTGDELIIEEVIEADQSQFTPAYGSPYNEDTSANYWTTPMDITDEAAVWAMLTAPITVIDGNEKSQIALRATPDEDGERVGVVTCSTQGVHVLERGDEWSLVECYSSSFHDSKTKAWNMLVQGYVKTDLLVEKTPSQERGIVVDKLTQRLYIFQDGKLFTTLLVSTGLANERQPYNETRSGEFLLTSAVGEFASDNLYCSMAIRFNDGDLLHEVPHTKNADGGKNYANAEAKLGTKASHGCIRVQRKRTPEGVNMQWLWDNRIKNTRMVIWEDWQGRQIAIPDAETTLYYNPNGGTMYHTQETCYSVKNAGVTFEAFTYGQLEDEPYASLERCEYCTPPLRVAEIEAINEVYAEGGDHDPVMTEARQKFLNGEYD